MLRGSQKPTPSYIIQFDELNRSRWAPEPGNSLKFTQTHTLQNIISKSSEIEKARKFKAKSTIPKDNNYRGGGMGEAP